MSIFEYNGSALVAMVGKNCFAIASDHRLGVQLQTIATDFQRIFKIHDKLYVGLSGLATDVQTLHQRFAFRHKLYQLREERNMRPETFASLVSALLYEKRFGPYFCQPVIAGLGEDDKPFICTMDSIGAKSLQVGDMVLLWDRKNEKPGKHKKFDSLWLGPYIIRGIAGPNSFHLSTLEGGPLQIPANGQLLKLFFKDDI